VKALLN